MLGHLRDPANAITAIGIAISGTALATLITGRTEIALALGLCSVLADQVDGVVAGRTRGRDAETAKFGKCLDALGDLLYGATLPALVIVTTVQHSPFAVVVAALLLVAGALRLSYFSVFGLSDGAFYGVPLSYDVPLLSFFFLARPWIPAASFAPILIIFFAILAVLHMAPLRIPAPRGGAYIAITALCIVLSIALLAEAMWLHRTTR
ncbi:CDP-alcohol phosphatidyltransferase family protein [Rhizobium calliandrae]|uniref:CDP-alcohol phosphatidyltransferase family protein n=1 Tax=Rhizobium calliandrae TaxID=1312182 RepID=A0ABT7KJ61_9HYPH|nr:CDP-alcohol phosphatidyltransferase family protein [Rhizobium calliandrae]MDL2408592.1 CDP-alcohol phosphatidyltransferase family protein [Rhizobium calliandrae]